MFVVPLKLDTKFKDILQFVEKFLSSSRREGGGKLLVSNMNPAKLAINFRTA